RASSILDVELSLLPGEKPLKDQARVRIHLASAERLGRVRLLGTSRLGPGESAPAQLRLESPAVARRGDHLILRSRSPATTPPPPRRRRRAGPASGAAVAPAAAALVEESGAGGVDAPTVAARLTVPLAELVAVLDGSSEVVLVGREPVRLLSARALASLAEAA